MASGIGTAVRSHVRAMRHAGIPLRLYPFVFSPGQARVNFAMTPEERHFDVSIAYANSDATERFLAMFGSRFTASLYRIGVWVWELPAAPPASLEHAKAYDEIWVPSTFNKRAFSAITRTPVHHVPYAVGLPPAEGGSFRGRLGIPEGDFVFLYMFDASSYVERKNPHALLEAFAREFAADDRAHLVLKISYLDPRNPFAHELARARQAAPRIRVMEEVLRESELASLLSSADCYVSPHRSEGFGFTLAEAMLLGRPVIATDYGSTRDFLDEETGFPVPYHLLEIERDIGAFYPRGAVWADIDVGALARTMRLVRDNPSEARRRALAARERVEAQYSEEAIGRRIAARLAASRRRS